MSLAMFLVLIFADGCVFRGLVVSMQLLSKHWLHLKKCSWWSHRPENTKHKLPTTTSFTINECKHTFLNFVHLSLQVSESKNIYNNHSVFKYAILDICYIFKFLQSRWKCFECISVHTYCSFTFLTCMPPKWNRSPSS